MSPRLPTLLLSLCLLLLSAPSHAQTMTPAQAYVQAKNTFAFGDYAKAAKLFRALLYPKPGRLKSKHLRVRALKLMGIALFYLHNKSIEDITQLRGQGKKPPKKLTQKAKKQLKDAASQFDLLLFLDESQRLSPALYPPDLVAFFNQRVAKDKARRRQIRLRQGPKRRPVRVSIIRARIERSVHQLPLVIAFLPAGIPQFAMGENVKGTLFLTVTLLSLGVNQFAYWSMYSLQSPTQPGTFPADRIKQAERWQATYLIALVPLAAALIYGYIDGFVGYFRHGRRRESLLPIVPRLQPKDLGKAASPHPGATSRFRSEFR